MEMLESHPLHGPAAHMWVDAGPRNRIGNRPESKHERLHVRSTSPARNSLLHATFFHMRFPCPMGGMAEAIGNMEPRGGLGMGAGIRKRLRAAKNSLRLMVGMRRRRGETGVRRRRVLMLNVAGTKRFTERLKGKVLEALGVAHPGACQLNKLLCYRGRHWLSAVNQAKGAQDHIEDVAQNSNLIRVK